MVKSSQLIKILISIDTLISFEGIIPSFSILRRNLLQLLGLLRKALEDENIPEKHVEQLCWLITKWLDQRILPRLDRHTHHRNDYSLEFGLFQHVSEDSSFAKRLASLLHESSEPVTHYARQIGLLNFARAAHNKTLMTYSVPDFSADSSLAESQQLSFPARSADSRQTNSSSWHPAPIPGLYWLAAFLMTIWVLSILYLEISS